MLTNRQLQILWVMTQGDDSAKAIGERLGIHERTVRNHLQGAYQRTGTSTKMGLLLYAIRNKWIVLD